MSTANGHATEPQPETPPVRRWGKSCDRQQVVAMQRAMAELSLDAKTPPHIRAQCARAWSELQDAKRVLDGKPLPGSLRPEPAPSKRKGTVSLLNTAPDPKP